MSNNNSIEQLKTFLKEMFQFNSNDLDFGIYRIYNLKRKEIENFIDGTDENCLEPIINKTLELVSNIEKQVELTNLTVYLKKYNSESLVNDPIANFKDIQTFIDFNKDDTEKESLTAALTASTKEFNITDEIKDKIYNHILGFFEMYYSNGDFGYNNRSRNLYKVPYEADYDGNDTMFHWKHKGSLYIKTGASFNAIKFKINHIGKEFELRLETNETSTDEEVARNNNKDSKQKHYKFNRFEEIDGVTRIVFNLSDKSTTKADLYKSLFKEVFKSDEDIDKYLFSEGKAVFNDLTDDYDKVQDGSMKGIGSLRVSRKTLLPKINKNFERGAKIDIENDRFTNETLETIYNIDQKLNSFYIGNDSDYFIHENLQDFLTQEKERYIKNHILSDLKTILDGKLDNTTLIIAKAFESVSSRIIEFLSTIEEFQKKLFTMKKKVVESEFCLTIDNIDEKYYPEILANKDQILEWGNLFSVTIKTLADLKAQPTLVLDSRHFKMTDGSNPFKDNVLGYIEDIDEKTNGVLICSENYQALTLIQEKYGNQIKCTYNDPPYNTGNDAFIYKDNFRHSSWLSLMEPRLKLLKSLLKENGIALTSIDDNEINSLRNLFNSSFGIENFVAQLIWRGGKRNASKRISTSHEYMLFFAKNLKYVDGINEIWKARKLGLDEIYKKHIELKKKYKDDYHSISLDLKKWYKDLPDSHPSKDHDHYCNVDKRGVYFASDISRGGGGGPKCPLKNPETGNFVSIPSRGWAFSSEKELLEAVEDERVHFNGDGVPCSKTYLKDSEVQLLDTVFYKDRRASSKAFRNIMGDNVFDFPKDPDVIANYIRALTSNNDFVIDAFAGSGSTGEAIIKANLEDNGSRHFILIEMGKYFDNVLKKRIQKVVYSSNWKKEKPINNKGLNKFIFKYLKIEQYEDVLDNIEQSEEETPKNLPLKYLYKPELNKINSTLDISKPFNNKIKYGQPTKEGFIDLVDTYNYLQGYELKTMKAYTIDKKYYKVIETTDNRIVVWRDINLGEDDSKTVIEIAEKYPEIDIIEVNFDFNILATLKDKQLQIGKRVVEVRIIQVDVFNQ